LYGRRRVIARLALSAARFGRHVQRGWEKFERLRRRYPISLTVTAALDNRWPFLRCCFPRPATVCSPFLTFRSVNCCTSVIPFVRRERPMVSSWSTIVYLWTMLVVQSILLSIGIDTLGYLKSIVNRYLYNSDAPDVEVNGFVSIQ